MSDEMVEIGNAPADIFSEDAELESLPKGEQSSKDTLIGDSSAEKDEYIIIKRSHVHLALILIAFAVGLGAGYLLWGRESSPFASLVLRGTNSQEIVRFTIPIEDDPSIGPVDAPIVIVEFSDFNCPFCRQFHQETFKPLLESYPDQIRFIYRDFAFLSPESVRAAQAAECAREQNAYWEFHNALFSGTFNLGSLAYETYAAELGLDAQALLDCVESGRYEDEIASDRQFASDLGVTGTPTFFINGIPLVGAQSLSKFQQIIDEELGL